MATAHTVFVPGVGYRWELRDGTDVLVEGSSGFADAASADAAATEALGSDWPGTPADGTWHYVGDTDEPTFENSWANANPGKDSLAFRVQQGGEVDIHGTIDSGSEGTVVFTLPADLWPIGAEQAITAHMLELGTNDVYAAAVEIGEDGEVAAHWASGVTLNSLSVHGSYYLNPPTGP